MCYGLVENFARSFLILFLLRCEFLSSVNSGHASSLSSSEEIKSIFSQGSGIRNAIHPDLNGTFKNKSFAEGGLLDVSVVPITHSSTKKPEENLLNTTKYGSASSNTTKKQYMTSFQKNLSQTKSFDFFKTSTYKTLLDTKLPDAGSSLFLGIPEVIHVNGTSSVKPRKGVDYNKIDNKIVPRKGVDNENKQNYSSFENYLCFQLSKNDCYNQETQDMECSCCKEGNAQAEIFKQQSLVDCNKCKPMSSPSTDKFICENICCKSIFHDMNSPTAIQNDSKQLKNNSKPKPTITKVPYDVEVVTELLSKAKQKAFVPIVVSLFLLPVIGIFIYFIWRRTKDYWEKRFYKKMDFLIDGMYND